MNQNANSTTLPPDAGKHVRELLCEYLHIYDDYHSQKETMAYSVVTLYLLGSTALYVQAPFWLNYSPSQIAILLLVLTGTAALGFALVRKQWQLAERAGDIYQACVNLANRWLTVEPTAEQLQVQAYPAENVPLLSGFFWPKAVIRELDDIKSRREQSPYKKRLTPKRISYAAMILWGLFLAGHIVCSWLMQRGRVCGFCLWQ